jgi:leucyl-tRNA synthetase
MILGEDGQKMSKSRGNVVNPDDMIREYGADTLRTYEMFMGPLEQVKPWNSKSIGGVFRFLNRVWSLIVAEDGSLKVANKPDSPDSPLEKALHRLIKKVGDDIEGIKFHTAIAAMMSFINDAYAATEVSRSIAERFVILLSPFAPHIAEELWSRLGHTNTLAYEPWPTYDEKLAKLDVVNIAIQVNGKLRDTIQLSVECSEADMISAALSSEKISAQIAGKEIKRKIVVPGRLVNIVVQ